MYVTHCKHAIRDLTPAQGTSKLLKKKNRCDPTGGLSWTAEGDINSLVLSYLAQDGWVAPGGPSQCGHRGYYDFIPLQSLVLRKAEFTKHRTQISRAATGIFTVGCSRVYR